MPFALIGVIVAAIASSMAVPAAGELAAQQPVIDARAGGVAAPLKGVWREIGSGRLLRIGSDGYDLYHETRILCYRDEGISNAPLTSRYSLYDLSSNGTALTLYYHDLGSSTRVFRNHERYLRVASLPALCVPSLREPRFERPEATFDLFWQTFADHYAFFGARGVDWERARTQFRPRVRPDMTPADLFDLFSEMLGPLNDGHVNLYLGQDRRFSPGRNTLIPLLRREFESRKSAGDFGAFVSEWVASQKAAASALVGGSIRKVANDTVWWGHVDGDIGYINIYALNGFTPDATWSNRGEQLKLLDDALEEIFVAFRQKRAILLDLTHNQGGFDAASDLIASRFADQTRHALTIEMFGVPTTQAERVLVVPSTRARFTRPVFVLTSEVTVSAGEGLVAMLRAFPHVTHVGQPTRGYLSGILNKPLPASLAASVTSQIIRTAGGASYEAHGIPPQVRVEVFPPTDVLGGYPRALQTTVDLIRTRLRAR